MTLPRPPLPPPLAGLAFSKWFSFLQMSGPGHPQAPKARGLPSHPSWAVQDFFTGLWLAWVGCGWDCCVPLHYEPPGVLWHTWGETHLPGCPCCAVWSTQTQAYSGGLLFLGLFGRDLTAAPQDQCQFVYYILSLRRPPPPPCGCHN